MSLAIGVDVGASKIDAALVSQNGRVLNRFTCETGKGQKTVIANIITSIGKVYDKKAKGIGIGMPGAVDDKGNVFDLTNISWKKTNLASIIQKRFHKPVRIENDADCFALGEYCYGKAKGKSPLLAITLGSGVGGGLVIEGKIYKGIGSAEFGHSALDPSGPKHGSNIKGSFEAWCSGDSIERAYKKKSGKNLAAKDIAISIDKHAKSVMNDAREHLAVALASLVNSLSPRVLVIGGGASRNKAYADKALARMKKLARPSNLKGLTSYISKKDSGILGAASLL